MVERLPELALSALPLLKGNNGVHCVCCRSFQKGLWYKYLLKQQQRNSDQHFLNCRVWSTEPLWRILQVLEMVCSEILFLPLSDLNVLKI